MNVLTFFILFLLVAVAVIARLVHVYNQVSAGKRKLRGIGSGSAFYRDGGSGWGGGSDGGGCGDGGGGSGGC